MSQLRIAPLQSYSLKIAGIIITTATIISMVIFKSSNLFALSHTMSHDNQFDLLLLINCLGLFLIAFSREKHEDERITLLRDRTFRVSFSFLLALLLSNAFVVLVFSLDPVFFSMAHIVPIDVNIALAFHLLLFYFRIYTNTDTTESDSTLVQTLAQNRTFFLIYLVITIITCFLLICL